MLRREFLLGVTLLLSLIAPASAIDEVVRQSQGSARGTIKSITSTEVTLEAVGQSTAVPATDIAAVRWDGEPPQLNITRTRESNGDLEFALQSYREIMGQVDAGQKNLKTDLEFLIARTLARQAVADPSKKDAAIKALNDFVTAHSDFFRYYDALEWLGRVQVAAGDYEAAKATYGRVVSSPLPAIKMSARNALARVKLEQEDFAGALADFDSVLAEQGNDPATSRQRFSAKLGRAIVLQKQGKQEEAISTLEEVILQASDNDSAVQAEAHVRLGTSLQAVDKEKDALIAFLFVDVMTPGEAEARAEALYYLSKLWPTAGQAEQGAERAADARRRLTEQYPASEWVKKL